MWLGKQQRREHLSGEGRVGRVTIGGAHPAVELACERRSLEVYAPGGYRWTPRPGQKVLVIEGQGERPCVVGLRQGEQLPEEVTVESENGGQLCLTAAGGSLSGENVELKGNVLVNGETLETFVARIVMMILLGAE